MNENPFLALVTDRTGTITRVKQIVRDVLSPFPSDGGHTWLTTARYERWVIPTDAEAVYVPLHRIPRHHILIASDLRSLESDVPAFATREPPEHIAVLARELVDRGGHPVCLDGPHSRTFPWDLPDDGRIDPGPFEWRIGSVRDRIHHVLAMVGEPEPIDASCFTFTLTAWARELDESGERTRRYADIPSPQRVESLSADLAALLLETPLTYS